MGGSLVQRSPTECLEYTKKPPVCEATKVLSRTVEPRRRRRKIKRLTKYRSTVILAINVFRSEGKRPLGRPRRRWEYGIIMDLREIGWWSVEWTQSVQERDRGPALVNTAMNLWVLPPRS
jgi:hypothetical protein